MTNSCVNCGCPAINDLMLCEDCFDAEMANDYDDEPDTVKCGCRYCPCFIRTEYGEVCDECRRGIHCS